MTSLNKHILNVAVSYEAARKEAEAYAEAALEWAAKGRKDLGLDCLKLAATARLYMALCASIAQARQVMR